jgi:hypothetical protein
MRPLMLQRRRRTREQIAYARFYETERHRALKKLATGAIGSNQAFAR